MNDHARWLRCHGYVIEVIFTLFPSFESFFLFLFYFVLILRMSKFPHFVRPGNNWGRARRLVRMGFFRARNASKPVGRCWWLSFIFFHCFGVFFFSLLLLSYMAVELRQLVANFEWRDRHMRYYRAMEPSRYTSFFPNIDQWLYYKYSTGSSISRLKLTSKNWLCVFYFR